MLLQGVEPPGDAVRRQVNFGLDDRVAGQLVGQLADRKLSLGHRVEQLRHADEAVADHADARIDRTPVALAAENGVLGQHHVDDVGLADRRAEVPLVVPFGDRLGHAAAGAIRHNRPAPVAEDMVGDDRHGILFAQVPAGRVDHGQAIGVGILAEAHLGPGLGHGGQHVGEVFGGRLGLVVELSVGRLAEDGDLRAECFEQQPTQRPARPVVRIEQNREATVANPLDVDRGKNGFEVGRGGVVTHGGRADPVVTCPGGLARPIMLEHFLSQCRGNHASVVGEELQPVVGRRVVTGGDPDGAGRLVCADQQADGGRGANAQIDRPMSAGPQSGMDGLGEHLAGGPAVASDQYRPGRARGGERGHVSHGHLRGERLADDTPQARNADDRLGHGRSFL